MRHVIAISSVAAALAIAAPAFAQQLSNPANSANARFCHQQGSGTDTMNCTYATLDACQKIATAQGGNCVQNPKMTTGSGSGARDNMKKQ